MIYTYTTQGITCPKCGAFIDSIGVSHSGSGGQWECRYCGWIGQTNL